MPVATSKMAGRALLALLLMGAAMPAHGQEADAPPPQDPPQDPTAETAPEATPLAEATSPNAPESAEGEDQGSLWDIVRELEERVRELSGENTAQTSEAPDFVRYHLFYDLSVICRLPPCFILYQKDMPVDATEVVFSVEDVVAQYGVDEVSVSPILKNHGRTSMDFNKLDVTVEGISLAPIEPITGGIGGIRLGKEGAIQFHWRTFDGDPIAGAGVLKITTVPD
ncbi:MAG: hypothetical protein AAFS07_05565 [Pseudomonadota bacterium]